VKQLADNTTPPIPNQATRSLICVNGIESADISGLLYNPYLPGPVDFFQIADVIRILEVFFNNIRYPQATFSERSFLEEKAEQPQGRPAPVVLHRYMPEEEFEKKAGRIATFEIQVLYRKNASWQGTFRWREKDSDGYFNSALEMIRRIDSAIQEITGENAEL
jgi:hypothetical protein